MFHDYLRGSLEALLFAAGEPLSVAKLAEIMQLDKPQVWELLSLLERDYEDEKRGLYLRKVAEGYQLCTKEQHYELIKQLARSQEMKLSNAAMETLAIIAFKQPVTRSEMEAIRGVKVDGVVNTLLEYGLISETGRKDSIGHPILYGTTDKFLITFGLNSLKDLPEFPDILSEHENEPEQMSLMAEFNEELNKTEETELKKDRIAAEWIFKNIYPAADINDFSYGEVIAIMASTVAMTTEVRKSEIKNLRISSLGNGSVENIAKIAEESTKPSK